MQEGDIHPALSPVSWLIGKWKTISAKGEYPTIKSFEFCGEMEFKSVGQPLLNYTLTTWHPEKLNAMHLESGFLRIKPGTNEVAFMIAHNFGLTTLEEGLVDEKQISLKTTDISRMSFASGAALQAMDHTIKLVDDKLYVTIAMTTDKTPSTTHLEIVFERV